MNTYRDMPNPFLSSSSSEATTKNAKNTTLGSTAPSIIGKSVPESPGAYRRRSLSEPSSWSGKRPGEDAEAQEVTSIQVGSTSVEVDDEHAYNEEIDEDEPVRNDKGKGKEVKRKKRPDLGVRIDEIQPSSGKKRVHTPRKRNRADESSFMAGGYLAAIHGSAQRAKKSHKRKSRTRQDPSDNEDPSSSDSSSDSELSEDDSSSSNSENSESDSESSETGLSSSSDDKGDEENPNPSDDDDPGAGDPDDDDDDDPEPEQGDDDLEDCRCRKRRAAERKLKKQRRLIKKLERKIKAQKRSSFKASEPQKYNGE